MEHEVIFCSINKIIVQLNTFYSWIDDSSLVAMYHLEQVCGVGYDVHYRLSTLDETGQQVPH